MEPDYTPVAQAFAASRARRDALLAQAQSWTGCDTGDFGTFDSVTPVSGDELGSIYARLAALSVQRLRVLSAQLAAAYEADPAGALVYERKAYDPATEELVTIGQEVTALAKLEAAERDRLERLITVAVRLRLEVRSEEAIRLQGRRMAALVQAACEQAGLDWSLPETRRVAQRAVVAAEAMLAGR